MTANEQGPGAPLAQAQPAPRKADLDRATRAWLSHWLDWESLPLAELAEILSREIKDPLSSERWRARCVTALGAVLGRTPRSAVLPPPEPEPNGPIAAMFAKLARVNQGC